MYMCTTCTEYIRKYRCAYLNAVNQTGYILVLLIVYMSGTINTVDKNVGPSGLSFILALFYF